MFLPEPKPQPLADEGVPESASATNELMNVPENAGSSNIPSGQESSAFNRPDLPPIVAQILEAAAKAPPPPMPLGPMEQWNYNTQPSPNNDEMIKQPTAENSINVGEMWPDKTSQPTQLPTISITSNVQESTLKPSPSDDLSSTESSTTKPPEATKPFKPIAWFNTIPLYQAAYYNQYNAYIPYAVPYGVYNSYGQNMSPQPFKKPTESIENQANSKITKNIIIKLSKF